MYYVSKRMEVAGAHQLYLDYESGCRRLHGHNWIIVVYCRASVLNHNGMIVDFKKVKECIHDRLDHQYVNDIFPGINPTAENIARLCCEEVNKICGVTTGDGDGECYKVSVQESEGNVAVYEVDKDGMGYVSD